MYWRELKLSTFNCVHSCFAQGVGRGGALVKGNVEVPMIVENFRYEDGNEYEI